VGEGERRWNVLDLGPALGGNIAFLGSLGCRLTIADALAELVALGGATAPEETSAGELEEFIPKPAGAPWDLVLCWDLINYLPRPVLSELMLFLAPKLRQRALVHAFVQSARPLMPPVPGTYELDVDARLHRTGPLEPQVKSPRFSHSDLMHCWPAFSSEKSVLLQCGLQEYLFRYG
jgi:hypothetical protein